MDAKKLMLAIVVLVFGAGLGMAQTEWVEYDGNPVVPGPDPAVYQTRYTSTVVEVDGTYHMYFIRQPVDAGGDWADYEICHATSSDGVAWEMDPTNPVVAKGADGEWDDVSVSLAAVIHDQSGFRMWYGADGGDEGAVGYATSPDGSSWTKYEGNPVMDVGPPGSFDDEWVLPGTVIVHDGLYRMWYSSSKDVGDSDTDWRVGYAESSDGLTWTKHPTPVLEPGHGWDSWLAYAPSVMFDGANYHMWYIGSAGDFGIGYAVSVDGIEWVKHQGNPVLGYFDGDRGHPAVLYNAGDGRYDMWFTDFGAGSNFTFGYATSECCKALAYLSVLPAAAFAAGAEGSFYRTDLDLSNRGDAAVEYELWWLPRGEDNTDHMTSEPFSLAGGASVRYANVVAEAFDLEPGAFGAVAIAASSPDLLAMGRIYTQPETDAGGTYGQAMPAIGESEMIQPGDRKRILFATENADMRTNIGCQNGTATIAPVEVELYDSTGTLLESTRVLLGPWSNQQFNRIFDDYRPVMGYVEVWTMFPLPFYCYGSVLDNTTSDPTTIEPQ